MKERIVDGIVITTNESDMTDSEIREYISRTREAYVTDPMTQDITALNIQVKDNDVEISYTLSLPKFERIRRITGELKR